MTAEQSHAVQPNDIDTSKHFWNSFDHNETEISANYIVAFCQERGRGWGPFTYEEINAFYQKRCTSNSPGNFTFNRLVPGTHNHMTARSFPQGETRSNKAALFLMEDGSYQISDDFITRCHRSSPSKSSLPT